MGLINSIFGKKEVAIKSYPDFWKWFETNEKVFLMLLVMEKILKKIF